MTQNREFYAATVEEAVEKAASALGATPEEVSYDVVDSGAAGFLGIGARDARIVVHSSDPDLGSDPEETTPADHRDEALETAPAVEGSSESAVLNLPPVENGSEGAEPVPEGLLAEIETFVTSVLGEMGFKARIDVYDAGEVIAVDVASQETGLFIGQKGETIDALQYLVNVAVFKNREFSKRIVLDSEGYRQRRVEALQGMAHRTARRAIRERRRVELPPMNSAERRIVHVYLKDNPAVVTASEGTGSNRRVTVFPA